MFAMLHYRIFNDPHPSSSSSHYYLDNGFKHLTKRRNVRDSDCESTASFSSSSGYGSIRSGRSYVDNGDRPRSSQARPVKKVKFALSRKKSCVDDSLQDRDDNCVVKFIGYKYIHELNEKQPMEIVCKILETNSPFAAFLNEPELEADWLMLVVAILKKVCSSSFSGNISEALNRVLRSQLMHAISYYLSDVETEKSEATIANMKSFLEDLTDFLSAITNVLPHVAVERDLKKVITKTIKAVEKVNTAFEAKVDEALTKKLETLVLKLDNYKEVCEQRNQSASSAPQRTYQDRLSEMSPPNDFREMSLHPTCEDLMRSTFGFIRPNKKKGAYLDVNHYLDVQFRLLREDFIDPLRTGLKQYAEAKTAVQSGNARKIKSKYESVRFYKGTKFEHSCLTKSHELGFILVFDGERRLKIKWEYSK
jgi:hypothetical protein